MSSADKLCKQFGPRSGPTKCAILEKRRREEPVVQEEMLFKEKIYARRTKTDHNSFGSGELKMGVTRLIFFQEGKIYPHPQRF